VNLPLGESVEILLNTQRPETPPLRDLPLVMKNGVPVFQVPPDAVPMTMEDVKRFQDDEY
jgi:hypothetical protein